MRARIAQCAAVLLVVGAMVAPAFGAPERIYEVRIEGKRAGYSRYSVERAASGLVSRSETAIKVSLLGASFDMMYRSVMTHSSDARRLVSYRLDFTRGDQAVRCLCSAERGRLRVATTSGGATTTRALAMGPAVYLIEGNNVDTWQRMFTSLGTRRPARVRVFAPLAGAVEPLDLKELGRAVVSAAGRRWACDRVRAGEGASAIEILLERGTHTLVELRVPAQKAAIRLADKSALTGLTAYDPGSRLFCVVSEPLPEPAALTRLRARARIEVAGEKPTLATLRSGPQSFTGTVSNGRIEGVFDIRPLVYDGARSPKFGDRPAEQRLAPYLKVEANVESDDPEIVALARKLTDGSSTTWEAVRKIGAWVKANIAYAITGSGARECLRSRKGDCGPHTWLTIALCRAVGIPARLTGGILYSRALGGSFGQHYWTRVWMGSDGWVPIDTTTGEVGTLSPAHVVLWDAGAIGSLDVKVLDWAPRGAAGKSDPPLPRRAYQPRVGDSEKWAFTSEGKEIAVQSAECIRTGDVGGRAMSEWRFEFRMPSASAAITGALSVWSDASPRRLAYEASVGGTPQQGEYVFSSEAVEVSLKLGQTPANHKHALRPGQMLQMNNLLTAFSLVMRSMGLRAGETRTVPFYAASSLQTLDLTFKVEAERRTVTVMGRDRAALVCDVQPINNRFFLDPETGELLRVEGPGGKLIIERR